MADDKVNLHDFSRMLINLSEVEQGETVVDHFPELVTFPIYTEATDQEVRVAIFMVDRHGPFSGIKKYITRLEAIFKWLKYDAAGAEKELFDSISFQRNMTVAKIWTTYLEDMFDHEWTTWFTLSLTYYQMMEQIRKPIDWNDQAKAEGELTKRMSMETKASQVYDKIQKLEAILFVDDMIKRRAFIAKKEILIENYAEKYAETDSVQ